MENSFVNKCLSGAEPIPVVPQLMPIGIFWDIENIQVPFNRSVIKLVQRIRRLVVDKKYRESEFQVVCDINKANKQVIDDLNSSQVTVIHVSSTAKNAADDKIKQLIHRFIETNGHNSAVVVITDDVNFACVLSDLKYHFKVEVTLIQRQASPALQNSANTVIDFKQLCDSLPLRSENQTKESIVLVSNLPNDRKPGEVKKWLNKLSSNCGGKKISVNYTKSEASIRFGCLSDAKRAQQRIDREVIFGKIIKATLESIESTTDSSDTNEEVYPLYEEMSKYRPRNNSSATPELQMNELLPYCSLHSQPKSRATDTSLLPMVNISISILSKRVHRLLDTHGGGLPLKSFVDCYVNEFFELFNTNDRPMVALEHMITCVPGACISASPPNHIKRITWIPNRDRYFTEDSAISEPQVSRTDQSIVNKLQHFGKEVRELLKSQPHSTVAFNKFVPSYHNHFVRQLCVGNYGCLKLSELLDEIPHIVQVFGENDSRMITLTHREQTKRFANDLIKVLKAQNGRRIKLSEFSIAYQSIFEKPFDVCDYGVCYIDDILRDVWEGTVLISQFGTTDKWLELPKRDRTADHKRRTTTFTQEVFELLTKSKEVVDFQLSFSKFIPCYHRYFNKQCRVSDYGFVKLIELLEELSLSLVDIGTDEKFGEKYIRLNYDNRIKALVIRFELILKHFDSRSTSVSNFELEYNRKFKAKIDFSEYYANDLIDLIANLSNNKFRIFQTKNEMKILLLDSNHFRLGAKRVTRLLMEEPNTELTISQLEIRYLEEFGQNLDTHVLNGNFSEAFVVNSETKVVCLTEMFKVCRDSIQCMQNSHKKRLSVEELDREMIRRFERPLPQPTYYKCRTICELFTKFFEFFRIEKRKSNAKPICYLSLEQQLIKKPLVIRRPVIQILKRPKTSVQMDDLIDSDNPETLPLPDLVPNHSAKEDDLIFWSSETSSNSSDKSCHTIDLMSFDETDVTSPTIVNGNVDNSWSDSCSNTGAATADETHSSKPSVFKIVQSFGKKSRIIANFS